MTITCDSLVFYECLTEIVQYGYMNGAQSPQNTEMKKTATGVVVLLAGAFMAYSQGTVAIGNYGALYPYIYVSFASVRLGGSAAGPPPTTANFATETSNGNDWTVALYGNTGANDPPSDLVPLKTADGQAVVATFATGQTDPASVPFDAIPGTWYSTAIGVIPGTTFAGPATVQLYAWYNDGGLINSYGAALAFGVPAGFSATANVYSGGPEVSGPPEPPTNITSIGSFELVAGVPEPGTIALGVLGASVILLRLGPKTL